MGDILIIGYGTVGRNLEAELKTLQADIFDKYKKNQNTRIDGKKYHIAFVCVDTPRNEDSICDTSEVKNAILDNEAEIYVIKSTVLPGTTDRLIEETGKRIVFSPEYYGATQHCNNFEFGFTIIGGQKDTAKKVIQCLMQVYDARHHFSITDSKTAELTKYMENCYLATKISFCTQFYVLAEEYGVDYEELRELFILDPRVNPSHTFVYRDHPFWESHCLDKDVRAIAEASDRTEFLNSVIEFNEFMKEMKAEKKLDA